MSPPVWINLLPHGFYKLTSYKGIGWMGFHYHDCGVEFIERFQVKSYSFYFWGMTDWPTTMIGLLGSGELIKVERHEIRGEV